MTLGNYTLTLLPPKRGRGRPRKVTVPAWQRAATAVWRWILSRQNRTPRHLRLRETVSLGDKRFVAVLEYEDRKLLIGGSATSVVLLTDLQAPFSAALSAAKSSELP